MDVLFPLQSKQSSSLSDRDTGEEDLESEDSEFWRLQRRLQEEARVALALARPMARMQVEVERQIQLHRRSPVADLVSDAYLPGAEFVEIKMLMYTFMHLADTCMYFYTFHGNQTHDVSLHICLIEHTTH